MSGSYGVMQLTQKHNSKMIIQSVISVVQYGKYMHHHIQKDQRDLCITPDKIPCMCKTTTCIYKLRHSFNIIKMYSQF